MNDDDGSDEGSPLPGNPSLREVVPAAATDRTSMIDLEAVQAKRDARRAEAHESQVRAGAGDDHDEDEATDAAGGPQERDHDATGTLARKARKKPGTQAARLVRDEQSRRDEPAQDDGAGAIEDVGNATGTRSRRDGTRTGLTRAGATQAMKRPVKRQPLSPAGAAAVVAIVVVGVIVAVFVAARATGVLTVTSIPGGALVSLDGEVIGTSPLQKRVRTGSHVVDLALDGFEPFREVVGVPADGLSFLQPLKALPPPPPPPPTPAEMANEIMTQAKRLFDAGDLDGAAAKVEEIDRLVPDHQPSREVRAAVRSALEKRSSVEAVRQQNAADAARLQRARQLSDDGIRLYTQGKLGPARTALYDALKLDAKNPAPHRSLAKIYNREDDLEKVRYHLERFLALGGNDFDFKVREWLKAHPK